MSAPAEAGDLARRLGARGFGGARWWTVAEIAQHYGYDRTWIRDWFATGWAADVPQRRNDRIGCHGGRIELWCVTPPPPPDDRRPAANRARVTAEDRAVVVAAVRARGGPPRTRDRVLWPIIAADLGLSAQAARSRYRAAVRLGEVPS